LLHPAPVPTLPAKRSASPFVVTDKDGADPKPCAGRIRKSADHELLALDAFDLLPFGAARPESITTVAQLADDSLGAERTRLGEELGPVAVEVLGVADHPGAAAEQSMKYAFAFLEWRSREVVAIEREDVEREISESRAIVTELLQKLEA
jgi:hypothetical protein